MRFLSYHFFRIASMVEYSTALQFLCKLSFATLVITLFYYWIRLAFFPSNSGKDIGLLGAGLSNIFLTSLLIIRWIESGHFPFSNLFESLLFLSWTVTAIHIALQVLAGSSLLFGVILSPIALFINSFATFGLPNELQKATSLVPALQSNWLAMHVSVMILSYGFLLSGSLLAIAFLLLKKLTLSFDPLFQREDINGVQETVYSKALNPSFLYTSSQGTPSLALYTKETGGFPTPVDLKSLETKNLSNTSSRTRQDLLQLPTTYSTAETFSEVDRANLTSSISLSEKKLSSQKKEDFSFEELEEIFLPSLPPLQIADGKRNPAINEKSPSARDLQNASNFSQTAMFSKLDNGSYRAIGLGFAFLTLGILSGAVWANEAWGSYWSWDPKETWAFITWIVYAIYLHIRLNKGWNGEKAASIATLGFVSVWICFLGVNLLGTGLHSYGWFS
jgi:ABC-type transport system involved in cytochrome c biogenesis permease subunit|uniref:Cytochrome c biogenesis protein CcsA n=1 Tax=Botryococcus braunii Showa TaxID=1202541 RepID=A0A160YI00_BOTBR|nr:heme attachment to plastid cytochrome c (chloroplast) [Botryococcus braunii Showa]